MRLLRQFTMNDIRWLVLVLGAGLWWRQEIISDDWNVRQLMKAHHANIRDMHVEAERYDTSIRERLEQEKDRLVRLESQNNDLETKIERLRQGEERDMGGSR